MVVKAPLVFKVAIVTSSFGGTDGVTSSNVTSSAPGTKATYFTSPISNQAENNQGSSQSNQNNPQSMLCLSLFCRSLMHVRSNRRISVVGCVALAGEVSLSRFIDAYDLTHCLQVLLTGPLQPIGLLVSPPVCHIKIEESR